MDLYGQEPEAGLLSEFISRVEPRIVVDVGAERGAFVESLLRAGAEAVHAIEPDPENAKLLHDLFEGDVRVVVHELAAGDHDGSVCLRRSVAPDGTPLPFGHTTLRRPDTDEITWAEEITVLQTTLETLAETGAIPAQVGILKIDTEGNDYAVLLGIGAIDCDVVMLEHWVDLPHSLGRCPWTLEDVTSILVQRGFEHFACVIHWGSFESLQWDDARIPPGRMGNVVFIHNRRLGQLLPFVLETATALSDRVVAAAEEALKVSEERLAMIAALTNERDLQAAAAAERLALLQEMSSGRGRTIERLQREVERQANAAQERLETIRRLERERELLEQAIETTTSPHESSQRDADVTEADIA